MQVEIGLILAVFGESAPPAMTVLCSKTQLLFCLHFHTHHLHLPSLQVFDVLPAWGELQPGQSELVTFTFFGHPNIVARVKALCHVQGGPTYQVLVTGEASCPSFQLDVEEIDWGQQVPQPSPGTAPCLGMVAGGFLPTSIPGSLPFPAPLLALGLRTQPWRDMAST